MGIALNALLVLLFVIIGGVFAATEMALVSLRESQIRKMERGKGAARTVAKLARDSGLFLSAVQIGVTFAGFFSSAFGASTIAPQIAPLLEGWGLNQTVAQITALVGMTLVVSYLSLVLGELVPKRMAMQKAESFSLIAAPPLNLFARFLRPVIWVVNSSSNLLLRALGFDPEARTSAMTTEEIREIVTSHEGFEDSQRVLVSDVFEASDRLVAEVMRHRSDMVAYDAGDTIGDIAAKVRERPYSRYPIYEQTIDSVVGFFHVRDLLEHVTDGKQDTEIREISRPIKYLPSTARLPQAMARMRASNHHIAIVLDEYGGTDGMVTLEDLIEELVGEIWDEYDRDEHNAVLALNESRLFSASMILEDFHEATGIALPDGPYETVAGWLVAELGRLAKQGDTIIVPASLTSDRDDDSDDHGPAGVRYELQVAKILGNRIISVELCKAEVPEGDSQPESPRRGGIG